MKIFLSLLLAAGLFSQSADAACLSSTGNESDTITCAARGRFGDQVCADSPTCIVVSVTRCAAKSGSPSDTAWCTAQGRFGDQVCAGSPVCLVIQD